jgi:hypothetical protein
VAVSTASGRLSRPPRIFDIAAGRIPLPRSEGEVLRADALLAAHIREGIFLAVAMVAANTRRRRIVSTMKAIVFRGTKQLRI